MYSNDVGRDLPSVPARSAGQLKRFQQPEAPPQVSSYIAIIRIIAVLGMGVCMSFGLFLMLIGVRGLAIGIPLFLMAIPCYFGMQWAEKLALRAERRSSSESEG